VKGNTKVAYHPSTFNASPFSRSLKYTQYRLDLKLFLAMPDVGHILKINTFHLHKKMISNSLPDSSDQELNGTSFRGQGFYTNSIESDV